MYLHEEREQFLDAIRMAVGHTGMSEIVIEKDYYVTMILRLLSQKLPFVVFKGGISLSKCHKVIRRFSEDIDITIDTFLSQGQKKKVKYTLVEIAEELGMDISNLEKTRSRRDYNRYEMGYESVFSMGHTSPPVSISIIQLFLKPAMFNLYYLYSNISLHLACAETGADILLTTDIKFLRGYQRIKSGISVKNPVEFIMEVFRYDESDDEYC